MCKTRNEHCPFLNPRCSKLLTYKNTIVNGKREREREKKTKKESKLAEVNWMTEEE